MSNRISPEPGFQASDTDNTQTHAHDAEEESEIPDYHIEDTPLQPSEHDNYLGVVRQNDRRSPDGQPDVEVHHAKPAAISAEGGAGGEGFAPGVAVKRSSKGKHHPSREVADFGKMSNSRPASAVKGKDKDEDVVIGANNSPQDNGCCAIILTVLAYILVIIFFPFSLCATIKVVQEYERAVIFRLGRLLPGGAKGPGIFFVMPCIEEYTKVDLRTVSFDVPPQEVLTRDSVTVSVDAVVYYRISSPTVSVANVENAANSTQLLAQTTLRNVLGTQNLAEILSNREHISEQMQNVLDDATDKWGIKVERVEIKDVRLPTQLQRAMAAEAEAARDARAKVIAAEGEQKASVALKEAADIIGGSPAALQLRYLQTLNSISAEKNSTIIFPLPIEFVSSLLRK